MRTVALLALTLLACARVPEPPTHTPPGTGSGWQCETRPDDARCDRTCPLFTAGGLCHFSSGAWCFEVDDGTTYGFLCAETEAVCNSSRHDPTISSPYVSLCAFEP